MILFLFIFVVVLVQCPLCNDQIPWDGTFCDKHLAKTHGFTSCPFCPEPKTKAIPQWSTLDIPVGEYHEHLRNCSLVSSFLKKMKMYTLKHLKCASSCNHNEYQN